MTMVFEMASTVACLLRLANDVTLACRRRNSVRRRPRAEPQLLLVTEGGHILLQTHAAIVHNRPRRRFRGYRAALAPCRF